MLITDGGEGCGGNPCKLIADIMRQRNDIKIDVIAIAGDENNSFMGLSCLSNATNGNFVVVNNSNDLYLKMKNSIAYLPHSEIKTEENQPDSKNEIVQKLPDVRNINENIKYSNYLFEFNN